MSLARKRARKQKKAAMVGVERGEKQAKRVQKNVAGAYVYTLRQEHAWRRQALRNLSACFFYSMHENYGFGQDRLIRLRDKMQSEFDSIVAGNISVKDISDFLRDDIGINCEVDAVRPGECRQRQIEIKAVKEMSAAFFMALLDEYGWKKKRLSDAYWHVAELSDKVSRGEIEYDFIRDRVEKIMTKKKVTA